MLAQPHEAVASGAVASFRTDVISPLKMEFDLLPIQNLNGQAYPYPPGDSAQIWDEEWEEGTFDLTTGEKKESGNYWRSKNTIPVQPNTLYYALTSGDGIYRFWYDSNGDYISYEGSVRDNAFLSPANAYFVNIVDVNRNAYNPATCPVSINYPATDTSYHPWKNICPITGHDGLTRNRTGKNLCNYDAIATVQANTSTYRNGLVFDKPGTYYVTAGETSTSSYIYVKVRNADGTFGNASYFIAGTTVTPVTQTITNGQKLIIYNVNDQTVESTKEQFDGWGVMVATTPNATYEQFTGVSKSTTFPTPPGTVYGCHFADNGDGTGTLTVDKEYIDGETVVYDCSGPYRNIYGLWVCSVRIMGKTIKAALKTPISDSIASFPDKTYTNIKENGIVKPIANFIFGILALTDETSGLTASSTSNEVLTAFNNYLNTLKPSFVYDIGEPISYTIPLDIIQSLIGQNNIWVDNADSVSVEYWGH